MVGYEVPCLNGNTSFHMRSKWQIVPIGRTFWSLLTIPQVHGYHSHARKTPRV